LHLTLRFGAQAAADSSPNDIPAGVAAIETLRPRLGAAQPRPLITCGVPARIRPRPVAILAETDGARIPELLPIRYGRMPQSPFTFLRGAAAVMAFDRGCCSPDRRAWRIRRRNASSSTSAVRRDFSGIDFTVI
jgi:hypothetical protein